MILRLLVKNIYCNWCVGLIRKDFAEKLGILDVDIRISNLKVQEITLRHIGNVSRRRILEVLERRGIEVVSFSH